MTVATAKRKTSEETPVSASNRQIPRINSPQRAYTPSTWIIKGVSAIEHIEKNIAVETAVEILAEQIAHEAARRRECLLASDMTGAESCKRHIAELMRLRTAVYGGDVGSIAGILKK